MGVHLTAMLVHADRCWPWCACGARVGPPRTPPEVPALVLAVDGFHDDLDPRGVLYTGMSRARDLLIVVAPEDVLEGAGGRKFHRRLLHHERTLPQS